MQNKNAKLQEQFLEEHGGGGAARESGIFEGVSIHVNGYTQPSREVSSWLPFSCRAGAAAHCILPGQELLAGG